MTNFFKYTTSGFEVKESGTAINLYLDNIYINQFYSGMSSSNSGSGYPNQKDTLTCVRVDVPYAVHLYFYR